MTGRQKMQLAIELLERFEALCKEKDMHPDPEILVLAIYASTSISERVSLFKEGIR